MMQVDQKEVELMEAHLHLADLYRNRAGREAERGDIYAVWRSVTESMRQERMARTVQRNARI